MPYAGFRYPAIDSSKNNKRNIPIRSAIAMTIVLGELCLPATASETPQSGFFSASKASLNLRTFGFRNDNLNGHEQSSRTEE